MRNMQFSTGLIALLKLGLVVAQVTFYEDSGTTIVVREGQDTNVEIICHYKVDDPSEKYSWLPHLIKFQDFAYVEEQESKGEVIDGERGVELVVSTGIKLEGELANIIVASMVIGPEGGQEDGEIKQITILKSPMPRDSGKYVCEAANAGEAFHKIHTLIVLPSSTEGFVTVELTGMADTTDNATIFKETDSSMIFYAKENANNPYGTIECRACGGASEPVIKMMIGDEIITGDIPMVEGPITTYMGDDMGMQTIHRCVARRHPQYQLTSAHNGKEITCSAEVYDGSGVLFSEAKKTLPLMVYHPATRESTGCDAVQYARLDQEGGITCKFSAVPSADMILFRDERFIEYEELDGDEWTMTSVSEGGAIVATLTFMRITEDNFGNYTLIVQNTAGSSQIFIDLRKGEISGASGLQYTLGLFVASMLLLWKQL